MTRTAMTVVPNHWNLSAPNTADPSEIIWLHRLLAPELGLVILETGKEIAWPMPDGQNHPGVSNP